MIFLLTETETLTSHRCITGPHSEGWGQRHRLPSASLSTPPALSMRLDINKSPVPTCKKEMKEEGKEEMTDVQTGKTRKPEATNLSTESRSPGPKHVFMPGSPKELYRGQISPRAGNGASWDGAQTLGVCC